MKAKIVSTLVGALAITVASLVLVATRPELAQADFPVCKTRSPAPGYNLKACAEAFWTSDYWSGQNSSLETSYRPISVLRIDSHVGYERCNYTWHLRWGPFAAERHNFFHVIVYGEALILSCTTDHVYQVRGLHYFTNYNSAFSWQVFVSATY